MIALLIGFTVICAAVVIFIILWTTKKRNDRKGRTPSFPTFAKCCATEAGDRSTIELAPTWMFMAIQSVDRACYGVGPDGNLSEAGALSKHLNYRAVSPGDFECRSAAGMPGGVPLVGGNWDGFCRAASSKGTLVSGAYADDHAVLIEGKSVVVVRAPFRAGGLVVRRGGTCYLWPAHGCCIEVGFIICESGGVLQAGSAGDSAYRVQIETPLRINLIESPGGYWHTGVPCSQYPTHVLNPGADVKNDQCYGADPAGGSAMCISNCITPKSIGVCFNGTCHLAGWVPASQAYKLWRARDGDTAVSEASMCADLKVDMLDGTFYEPEPRYPVTFVCVVGYPDRQRIRVDEPVDWPVGAQVCVSSPSLAWKYEGAGLDKNSAACGRTDSGSAECLRSVGFVVHGEPRPDEPSTGARGGIDVARIEALEEEGHVIVLEEPLVFAHSTGPSTFTSCTGVKIAVDTFGHVGLLSRAIIIEGVAGSASSLVAPFLDPAAMPFGRFNTPDPAVNLAAISCGTAPAQGSWVGPGGSVGCEQTCKDPNSADCGGSMPLGAVYTGKTTKPVWELYHESLRDVPGCSSARPPPMPTASSHYGQGKGCAGLSCVVGGSFKAMYASSVRLDGVELVRMGIPGNAGTLGQYSVHFHLAGWGRNFKSFTKAPRELVFCNSTNWRSYSRWAVLHGTNYASIVNNVFLLCAGQGIFFEDGVEQSNVVEHNLCLLALATARQKIIEDGWPLGGVIGNAGFDTQQVASIWLTNQNNYICRNVLACNPGASVGVWSVGEATHTKSGPANLCTGDVDLGLPGFIGNALCRVVDGVPQFRALGHPSGSLPETVLTPNRDGYMLAHKDQLHGPASLTLFPYRMFAENVCYNCASFIMEQTVENPASWFGNSYNDNHELSDLSTMYKPINGESGGSLNIHAWAGVYVGCGMQGDKGWTRSHRVWSQNLVFDLGGQNAQTTGGFTWIQDGGLILIGDCLLGLDYSSAASNSKIDALGDYSLLTFATILCNVVLGASIPGGGISAGGDKPAWDGACSGILIFGDCIVASTSCVGSQSPTDLPRPAPFRGRTSCNSLQDANSPSFLMLAGYTVSPLGDDNATRAYLNRLVVPSSAGQRFLRGISAADQNTCANDTEDRVVLFDAVSGKRWIATAAGDSLEPQVWKKPEKTPSCTFPPSVAGAARNPVGCYACAPTSDFVASAMPLQTEQGGNLLKFLCRSVSILPGYTS